MSLTNIDKIMHLSAKQLTNTGSVKFRYKQRIQPISTRALCMKKSN